MGVTKGDTRSLDSGSYEVVDSIDGNQLCQRAGCLFGNDPLEESCTPANFVEAERESYSTW